MLLSLSLYLFLSLSFFRGVVPLLPPAWIRTKASDSSAQHLNPTQAPHTDCMATNKVKASIGSTSVHLWLSDLRTHLGSSVYFEVI